MLLHVRTVSITPAGTPTTPSAPASEPAPVVVAPAPAPKLKKRQKSILPGDISATAVAAADARKAKADAVMRQRTATEMLQTEDSYIKCLRVLVEVREHLKKSAQREWRTRAETLSATLLRDAHRCRTSGSRWWPATS